MRLPRPRLPGFIRRHPFPWVFAPTLPVAVLVVLMARELEYGADTHEAQALNYLVQTGVLLLPLGVAAAWWRRLGVWSRSAALLVCVIWSLFALLLATETMEDFRRLVGNMRVVDELVREPRRAMETPPEVAAARALAAGDTSFLAVGARCAGLGGVDTATVQRFGVRVISGTFHDSQSLTSEHREFISAAHRYGADYNQAVLDRLGLERLGNNSCLDVLKLRRAGGRFFWP